MHPAQQPLEQRAVRDRRQPDLGRTSPQPLSPRLTVGRTDGQTTQTDSRSQRKRGKSQGRPTKRRAHSPSRKNRPAQHAFAQEAPVPVERPSPPPTRTGPPRSSFMPRKELRRPRVARFIGAAQLQSRARVARAPRAPRRSGARPASGRCGQRRRRGIDLFLAPSRASIGCRSGFVAQTAEDP